MDSESAVGRNLVVCCDGTGNLWRPGGCDTNVVRLFMALPRDDPQQLGYYDPGVGTPDGLVGTGGRAGLFSRDTLRRVAGLAWGDGVWDNVAQAYLFLCHHHQPGDRIYLFGFSRGAFTVRVVSGLIHLFGLLRPGHEHLMSTLLRLYRHPVDPDHPTPEEGDAGIREFGDRFCRSGVPVHFIGVWDTVETVGMSQMFGVGSSNPRNTQVKSSYRHVRHALALDELRWTFLPRRYTLPAESLDPGQTFRQVWFRGAHSDVGGGYAEAGLSTIALQWMAGQAHDLGLRLDLSVLARWQGDPCGTLHSEVTLCPTWALVGVFQREVDLRQETVHASVVVRAAVHGPERIPLPPDVRVEPAHALERWSAGACGDRDRWQRPPRWMLPAWVLCLLLLITRLWDSLTGQGLALAWEQQLGLARTHWWDLGRSLLDWSGQQWPQVVALLRGDQVFVLVYTAVLMLTVALWPQVPAARYPQRRSGGPLARVMLPLAGVDLLENQCTLWALALSTPSAATPGWWSHEVLVGLVAGGVALLSALKFVLLGAVLVLLLQMLLAWRPPRAAPRPVQG